MVGLLLTANKQAVSQTPLVGDGKIAILSALKQYFRNGCPSVRRSILKHFFS